MQIGEIYRVRTDAVFCQDNRPNFRPKVAGRVAWVHPAGRFAVLELAGGHRECYYPEELTEQNRVGRRNRR